MTQGPPLLKGQKALVTGASSGIGKAIAFALAEAGADVMVNYARRREEAETVAAELRVLGVRSAARRADVSREDEVAALFESAVAEFGSLDILVNNAGIQKDAPFAEMTLEAWERVLAVNLTGQFLCAREAVRLFRRQGPRPEVSASTGKILAISSVHETIPWAGHVNYAASKGGVMMMTKSIAQECAAQRIRVNAIAPGAIRTPINEEAWKDPAKRERLLELIPYGRIGTPEDVGRAAAWLVSDLADYVTGTTLFVDGGMTLYPGFETGG